MKTRHSSITRLQQIFIVTMKVEPDTDDERRLLVDAFDQESQSLQVLVNKHIANYVENTFPGFELIRADHEKYPTLLRVQLRSASQI